MATGDLKKQVKELLKYPDYWRGIVLSRERILALIVAFGAIPVVGIPVYLGWIPNLSELLTLIVSGIAVLMIGGAAALWYRGGIPTRKPVQQQPAITTPAQPAVDFSTRFAEEMMKAEVRKKRVSELEEHLANHYGEIIQTMQFWFEDNFPNINASPSNGPKVSYLVFPKGYPALGSAHWFSPPVRIEIQDLETRIFVRDSVDLVRSHLLGEHWERWQRLCDNVNGHLRRVEALWEELAGDISAETKVLGLSEWNGTFALGKPLDYYWMHGLFVNVWLDPEYFAQTGSHRWDEEKPVQGLDSYKNNANVWSLFSGQVQSSDKAPLEKLKPWLTAESDKIAPTKAGLIKELESIQTDFNTLHQGWVRLENDYRDGLIRRLPQSCSRCRPLLDELAELGA